MESVKNGTIALTELGKGLVRITPAFGETLAEAGVG